VLVNSRSKDLLAHPLGQRDAVCVPRVQIGAQQGERRAATLPDLGRGVVGAEEALFVVCVSRQPARNAPGHPRMARE
jgi:hypothetical protein